MSNKTIPFVDLAAQRQALGREIDDSIQAVLEHGQFIMGPEVLGLEDKLKKFVGSQCCVTSSSGTDALFLALMTWDVGPGDAVFVPDLTFVATAEVVSLLGATPVFVDVDANTFTMDPQSFGNAIDTARVQGLSAKAVIPVDLYGLPADYAAICSIARDNGLHVLADGAQSFGARHPDGIVGSLADATAVSFFPAKPLGCYGDGGAIFTDDAKMARTMESLRQHGRGDEKFDTRRLGVNARLDTIQAAVLLVKLEAFAGEFDRRQDLAAAYEAAFGDLFEVPLVPEGYQNAWAVYTLKATNKDERERVRRYLNGAGVPTAIYYPQPLHVQAAFTDRPSLCPDECPVAKDLCERVFSLPFHPYMDEKTIGLVVDAVCRAAV